MWTSDTPSMPGRDPAHDQVGKASLNGSTTAARPGLVEVIGGVALIRGCSGVGCFGICRYIARRLVAVGEAVREVPAQRSARVQVIAAGQGRKTDPTDRPGRRAQCGGDSVTDQGFAAGGRR